MVQHTATSVVTIERFIIEQERLHPEATGELSGITLGRTVWIAPGVPLEPELLLHELRHVHQFAADRAFPLRYVWRSLRFGYLGNPYEADARQFAASRVDGLPPSA